jgi:hypothetical protein
MATICDITEADESATGKAEALRALAEVARRFFGGAETLGVVASYERAALRAGATPDEADAVIWAERPHKGGLDDTTINRTNLLAWLRNQMSGCDSMAHIEPGRAEFWRAVKAAYRDCLYTVEHMGQQPPDAPGGQ